MTPGALAAAAFFQIGPLFSPSGRSLLFSRNTKGPESGEFFVWHDEAGETWPPGCPAR